MLEAEHMVALNTFTAGGSATYFGENSMSRIDYISVPQGTRDIIVSSRTLPTKGRELQLIPDSSPRDHRPLIATFDYQLSCQKGASSGSKGWDWEKIRWAARSVGGRRQFVEEVEELSRIRESELGFFPTDNTPDTAWHELMHDAQKAASVFRKGRVEEPNWVTAARERRGQLLDRRLQLRREGMGEDAAGLEEELKHISKSLYREGGG